MPATRDAAIALTSALLTITAGAMHAHANGRFPAAQHLVVGPATRAGTLVLRTTFGLLVSDDGGAHFGYVCEAALGSTARDFDPAIALDATARIQLGLYHGLSRLETDRCTVTAEPAIDGPYVVDLDADATGTHLVAVATPFSAQAASTVYRSDDGGEHWTARAQGPVGLRFDTIEMAATDPSRVYLTGTIDSPHEVRFFRSDDGGATLLPQTFPLANDAAGAYIAAVDPTDALTVYVRTNPYATASPDAARSVLLRTRDGGATWHELQRTQGLLLGFAIAPDGRTLWTGSSSPGESLQRSRDDGATWQTLADFPVRCLRAHDRTLFVCADESLAGFLLGRSDDDGATLVPMLHYGDVQPAEHCDPATVTTCTQAFRDVTNQLAVRPPVDAGTALDASVPAVDASIVVAAMDAGGDDGGRGARGSSGCGCRVAVARATGGAWCVIAIAAVAERRGRRRRTA